MKNGALYVANLCTLIPLAMKEANLKIKKLQMFACAVHSWIWTLHHPHTVTLGQSICRLCRLLTLFEKGRRMYIQNNNTYNTMQKNNWNVINQCMLHLGRDVGETSKRWSGAHMGFSKCIDTILTWTELNWTEPNSWERITYQELHQLWFQITEKY